MKTRFTLNLVGVCGIALLLLAIPLAVWAAPPIQEDEDGQNFQGGKDLPCLVHIDEVDYTSYYQCDFPVNHHDTKAGSLNFLTNFAEPLGLTAPSEDLNLVEIKHGLASTHTRFQQILDGYPVFGAYVSVHQGPDGKIQTVHKNYYSNLISKRESTKHLTPTEAEEAGQKSAGVTSLRQPSRSQLVWFPNSDNTATLAWEMTIFAEQPLGDFLTVVDAHKGDVLFQEDRLSFDSGSGLVYIPNPYQTQGNGTNMIDNGDVTNPNLDAQRINVTLLGLDSGTGLVRGEYVDLSTLNSTTLPDVDANEPTRVYNYDRDDARFEQVVIYYNIDSIQRYFQSLGFSDSNNPQNGIRDYPTLANAHWFTDDQSYYSTGDNAVHFGDGGVDDGEDADIIIHEYGHAVQHDQNANWGGGEMGAMGEGFGDYLAASFYFANGNATYQSANAACVGEWDATSYSGANPPCLRRVDGGKIYPVDLVGQVHADGEIWSRALWDIFLAVGAGADTIVLEHHFALPANATMPTAALEFIQADQNLNGGANEAVIRQAFCNRGILTGTNCGATSPSNSIYLPVILRGGGSSGGSGGVTNGDFEQGPVGWTEYSDHGWTLIDTAVNLPVAPHGGNWAVWLGGDYDDLSYIRQAVTVPSSAPYLTYWHWIDSVDVCGYDYGGVGVGGNWFDQYDLCSSSNTYGWVRHTTNMGAYAGQTIVLDIVTETDLSENSNLFIDDVSFQATAKSADIMPEWTPPLDVATLRERNSVPKISNGDTNHQYFVPRPEKQ